MRKSVFGWAAGMAGASKGKAAAERQRKGRAVGQLMKGRWRIKQRHAQADAGKLHPVNR